MDASLRGGESRLKANEWQCEDISWLIELVAPFGAQAEILEELDTSVFDRKPYHYHTVKDGRRVVVTH